VSTTAPDMTEEELLAGLTDALTIAGWRWTHVRRSDGVTMGNVGLPDLIAVHPTRDLVLAWELKSRTGIPTGDQLAWLRGFQAARGVDARLVRPAQYDDALSIILGMVRPPETGTMTWQGHALDPSDVRNTRCGLNVGNSTWAIDTDQPVTCLICAHV
jgi:hypothetical protein